MVPTTIPAVPTAPRTIWAKGRFVLRMFKLPENASQNAIAINAKELRIKTISGAPKYSDRSLANRLMVTTAREFKVIKAMPVITVLLSLNVT